LFQWQEDSLRAVATNAAVEGADASYITVDPTVMRTNYTQILTEAVQVSGSMDVISTYGRARESAYQMAKSAAQVKRDFENALVGTAQTHVVGNDSTARKFDGYQQMCDSSAVVYMGTGNTLDETHLLTCLQDLYTNGAEPNTVSVTPSNSVTVATFAKAAGRFRTIVDADSSSGKVVNAVDLYVSPFGEVKIILNRFQKSTNTLVYENTMWSKQVLRPWFREALAKTGDSTKQMIVGEFSLKHKNFKASGVIVDNATSGF
jgi:uncharacterized protein YhfF